MNGEGNCLITAKYPATGNRPGGVFMVKTRSILLLMTDQQLIFIQGSAQNILIPALTVGLPERFTGSPAFERLLVFPYRRDLQFLCLCAFFGFVPYFHPHESLNLLDTLRFSESRAISCPKPGLTLIEFVTTSMQDSSFDNDRINSKMSNPLPVCPLYLNGRADFILGARSHKSHKRHKSHKSHKSQPGLPGKPKRHA